MSKMCSELHAKSAEVHLINKICMQTDQPRLKAVRGIGTTFCCITQHDLFWCPSARLVLHRTHVYLHLYIYTLKSKEVVYILGV